MCGLAGYLDRAGPADLGLLQAMLTPIRHRGPDDSGTWIEGGVALGHQRLSIIDLSAAGHQPMADASGDWMVAYNGEIYNHEALRAELPGAEGRLWRGHSDTEVLCAALQAWGVAGTAQRLIGMFAFAAYHRPSQRLYLCRDRLGIKPLYYGWVGHKFVFGSELHALTPWRHELAINRDALTSYLRHNYIPTPASVYSGINKLKPGHVLCLSPEHLPGSSGELACYWDLARVAAAPRATGEDRELVDTLHNLLLKAVQDRMLADVPLGAFLSGGYDSSLVCALMQASTTTPIQTFTIGFEVASHNEAHHARAVADHLGTDHTELTVTEHDLMEAVAQLPQLMDEPFADSSILPTFLVSQLARRQVTVSLSGDGGDELFWGYNRYASTNALWARTRRLPRGIGELAKNALQWPWLRGITQRVPAPAWGGRAGTLHQKLSTLMEVWGSTSHEGLYEAMISHWRDPATLVIDGQELPTAYNNSEHWTRDYPANARMAWQDTLAYLPDDILTKVDRASMAVSLEARVPLLDHRVVEFAAQLPDHLKADGATTKVALRQVLARYVPPSITDRPKMGFGVPLADWLRGPLRPWAEDMLAADTLQRQGLFHPEPVQALLQQHLRGQANNASKLWDLLCVQVWLARS